MTVLVAWALAAIACCALCAIPPSSRAISYYRAAAALGVAGLWCLVVYRR